MPGLGGGGRWSQVGSSFIYRGERRPGTRRGSGTWLVWAEAGLSLPALSIMGCSEALPAGAESPFSHSAITAGKCQHWSVLEPQGPSWSCAAWGGHRLEGTGEARGGEMSSSSAQVVS